MQTGYISQYRFGSCQQAVECAFRGSLPDSDVHCELQQPVPEARQLTPPPGNDSHQLINVKAAAPYQSASS